MSKILKLKSVFYAGNINTNSSWQQIFCGDAILRRVGTIDNEFVHLYLTILAVWTCFGVLEKVKSAIFNIYVYIEGGY